MNACVIFDVSVRQMDVKAALKQMGYWASWSGAGTIYNLPSNSLWKPNCELKQAKNDIQSIIANLNLGNPVNPIVLQRCVVLQVNPWEGFPGEATL